MVERTEDGRHIVVNGRRWRATDPAIPEPLRVELVSELMAARRAVKDAGSDEETGAARVRVQDAKVALGERGSPWWEEASAEQRRERIAAAIRSLLRHRSPESTICPSDAARVVGSPDWRDLMDEVRTVARSLAEEHQIERRQRGKPVPAGVEPTGPIRLGRSEGAPRPAAIPDSGDDQPI